mmetsp:Transcript_15649/g.31835  ORF Transcript_15649/g.31835 Transcript_15649/m.31835 type:complete len:210 (-) Transcript_15649:11-640(-)
MTKIRLLGTAALSFAITSNAAAVVRVSALGDVESNTVLFTRQSEQQSQQLKRQSTQDEHQQLKLQRPQNAKSSSSIRGHETKALIGAQNTKNPSEENIANEKIPSRNLQSIVTDATQTWPHHLLLSLTFDARPTETSWKFENARTSKTLDARPFGYYNATSYSDETGLPSEMKVGEEVVEGNVVEERLDILTEGDLEEDWTTEGELREY